METRRTIVVQGPLAVGMRRRQAAMADEIGTAIVTLPQLAAGLAGGFLHLAPSAVIEPLIQERLAIGGFEDLEDVRDLPGMTRAVMSTLRKIWHADFNLRDAAHVDKARIRDLIAIEDHIRATLSGGALLAPDLRNAALARIDHARALFRSVRLDRIHYVEPVWRPLIRALRRVIPTAWQAPSSVNADWFGEVTRTDSAPCEPVRISCANPQHEAVEALRWARGLVASGRVAPAEIAICAATTEEWDEHVLTLSHHSQLPVHFPHGVPCLTTRDGQRCAALADVVLNGLTASRVRRLFSLVAGEKTPVDKLPGDWFSALRGASLRSLDDWTLALDRRVPLDAAWRPIVSDCLATLARGKVGAPEAADFFLRGRSRRLWEAATRAAPVAALELTLATVRVEDERDPGEAVAWCPAWQLAAAPRPYVRLLGLTSRNWPRRPGEDPVLPSHIVEPHEFDADPAAQSDLRAFQTIVVNATGQIVLSRGRRNATGSRVTASPLYTSRDDELVLTPTGLPQHALTESDRLFARPADAEASREIASALACWRAWHKPEVTAHDGIIPAGHAVVARAVSRVQSATSLTRLLRDPIGFVWRYALGWNEERREEEPLELSSLEIGRLVHELLRRTVDALEPDPGFTAASAEQIAGSLAAAADHVTQAWPLDVVVPPHLLWVHTVRQAAEMALAGLTREKFTEHGTCSWTEVPFGKSEADGRSLPWDASLPVTIPDTPIAIRGTIDRLDLRTDGAARVTDYKTGERPDDPEHLVIAGGAELQRVLYALACIQLLPEPRGVLTRLMYLREAPADIFPLPNLEHALSLVSRFVSAAYAVAKSGRCVPGIDAEDKENNSPHDLGDAPRFRRNPLRLALPASPGYFRRKRSNFRSTLRDLTPLWGRK